jgi:glutamate 5-kinase
LNTHQTLRIVVKVGTSTLTRGNGSLNLQNLDHLARACPTLSNMGHEVILVSSGASLSERASWE